MRRMPSRWRDRWRAAILLLPVAAVVAGCDGVLDALRKDDRCGPYVRSAAARNSFGPERDPLAMAQVHLVELRDDSVPPRVRLDLTAWNAPRSPLEGHVLSATLLDPAGITLARFPVGVGPGSYVISQRPVVVERAVAEAIRAHFISRDAILEIRTDLPATPILRTTLLYGEHLEYARAICPKNREE